MKEGSKNNAKDKDIQDYTRLVIIYHCDCDACTTLFDAEHTLEMLYKNEEALRNSSLSRLSDKYGFQRDDIWREIRATKMMVDIALQNAVRLCANRATKESQ